MYYVLEMETSTNLFNIIQIELHAPSVTMLQSAVEPLFFSLTWGCLEFDGDKWIWVMGMGQKLHNGQRSQASEPSPNRSERSFVYWDYWVFNSLKLELALGGLVDSVPSAMWVATCGRFCRRPSDCEIPAVWKWAT